MVHVSRILLERGCKHVPLRRLTQDHVENIFSMVRVKNGFNDRPEVTAFRCAVQAVSLSNLLRPITNSGNCEPDADHLLADVLESAAATVKLSARKCVAAAAAAVLVDATVAVEEFESDDDNAAFNVDDSDSEHQVSRSEEQVVDMLGGYCVTRLMKQGKLTCQDCCNQLLQARRSILLQERQYKECTKQALFSSSPELYQFLLHTERVCRKHLTTAMHVENIGKNICDDVWRHAPHLLCCHPAEAGAAVLKLYLRVRLHHHSRLVNATLKARRVETKQKKLKKLSVTKNK